MSLPINTTCRPLRILIVDDNHINLSILSTLLKRRFSYLIDGAPVSVDSGLKAIQLLRTHVFDCILMDIQMPFLSGLEASRRIRNAEDGILHANSAAHIVAVTTAIGDEPELAYKRAGMDGMIGKPVRQQQLQQYLLPLSLDAYKASLTTPPLSLDGEHIMPPLPSVKQVFYLPANATTPSTRPDICEGSDFEGLLHSQTRASLRRFGSITPAGSDAQASPLPAVHDFDTTLVEVVESESSSSTSSRRNSLAKPEKLKQSVVPRTPPRVTPSKHHRTASMTISQRTLSKQILREVANADLNGETSERVTCSRSVTSPLRHKSSRPPVMHRNSSPGWLLSDDGPMDASPTTKLKRPSLSIMSWNDTSQSPCTSGDCSESSEGSSTFPGLRRVSETSSGSISSDSSSTVTTPACDSALPFWAIGTNPAFNFARDHERTLSNGTANQPNTDDCDQEVKESWSASSDTATAASSPLRIKPSTADNVRHLDSLQDLAQSIRQLDLTS